MKANILQNPRSVQFISGILTLLLFAGFAIFNIEQSVVDGPIAAQVMPRVEQEFVKIQSMPDAQRANYKARYKPGHVLVDEIYTTTDSYEQIRHFYDEEMSRLGWRFLREDGIIDNWRDLGGKTATYCKADLEASLQYAGERAHYGWNYSLSVVWGDLARKCNRP